MPVYSADHRVGIS